MLVRAQPPERGLCGAMVSSPPRRRVGPPRSSPETESRWTGMRGRVLPGALPRGRADHVVRTPGCKPVASAVQVRLLPRPPRSRAAYLPGSGSCLRASEARLPQFDSGRGDVWALRWAQPKTGWPRPHGRGQPRSVRSQSAGPLASTIVEVLVWPDPSVQVTLTLSPGWYCWSSELRSSGDDTVWPPTESITSPSARPA